MNAINVWFPAIRVGSGADVFVLRLRDALMKRGIAANVTWFPNHYQYWPRFLSGVSPPKDTTVIHVNSWYAFSFKDTGIPLVVTEHQGMFGRRNRPYHSFAQAVYHNILIKRYVRASLRVASAATAVSIFAADGLGQSVRHEHVQPIYNFVDCSAFTPNPAPRINGPFRLLFVGNWTYLKGCKTLAAVMQRLGRAFELRFTSGLRDPPSTAIFDNMVPLGKLSRQEDMINEYRTCDAVIVPSFFEGFGYVALEAMACGKPVIASNNSAIPEVVEDGKTGILCRTGDVESFVAACRYLAANPDVAQRYGEAGRQRAVALFSEEVVVPQYVALYEQLTRGHG